MSSEVRQSGLAQTPELSESLGPRGFDLMFDLVAELDLPPGSTVLDVGAREAYHCIELSRRFGFITHGIEPVRRHLGNAADALDALAAAEPEVAARICMQRASLSGWAYQTRVST